MLDRAANDSGPAAGRLRRRARASRTCPPSVGDARKAMPDRRHRLRGRSAKNFHGRRWCWRRRLPTGAGGPCRLPGVAGQCASTFRRRRSRSARFRTPSSSTICASPAPVCMAAPPWRCRPSPWRRRCNASGRDLVTAIVAGIEVMFRIGAATLHSAEKVGFHGPGMTGPFGSAAACASADAALGGADRQRLRRCRLARRRAAGLRASPAPAG